jgi:hypothetical protein
MTVVLRHESMATNVRLTELAAVVQHHVSMMTSPGSLQQSDSVVSTHAVLEAVDELQLLLRGPVPYLMDMVIQQVKIYVIPTMFSIDRKYSTTP